MNPASSTWPRRVGVGVLCLLAIVGLIATVSRDQLGLWWGAAPHVAVALDDDGGATIGNLTVSLARVEASQELVTGHETVEAPQGWVLWLVSFDVEVVPGVAELGNGWLDVSVVASDRNIYTRPRSFTTSAPPGGWFDMVPEESGRQQDLVLLPEGVEPVRVRLVPNPRNPFWSFPVQR